MPETVFVHAAETLLPDQPLAAPADVATTLPLLHVAEATLARHVDLESTRRMARVSQLALAVGRRALERAGLAEGAARERLRLTFGSGFGGQEHTEEFYQQVMKLRGPYPSPMLFAESVMNAPAGHLSLQLGVRATVRTVTVDWRNGLPALCEEIDDLAHGARGPVLFVTADAPTAFCGDILARCRDDLRTPGGRPSVFVAGEGAVALVLARAGEIAAAPRARVSVYGCERCPGQPARALGQLALPPRRPAAWFPTSPLNGLAVAEERAVRRAASEGPRTVTGSSPYLFAAHGALSVASAIYLTPEDEGGAGPWLVTGVDPLGTAAFVELERP